MTQLVLYVVVTFFMDGYFDVVVHYRGTFTNRQNLTYDGLEST